MSRDGLPRIDLGEDPPFVRADYSLRVCWGAFCVALGLLAFLLTGAALWYFDAPMPVFLLDLLAHVRDAMVAMYWADASLHY